MNIKLWQEKSRAILTIREHSVPRLQQRKRNLASSGLTQTSAVSQWRPPTSLPFSRVLDLLDCLHKSLYRKCSSCDWRAVELIIRTFHKKLMTQAKLKTLRAPRQCKNKTTRQTCVNTPVDQHVKSKPHIPTIRQCKISQLTKQMLDNIRWHEGAIKKKKSV